MGERNCKEEGRWLKKFASWLLVTRFQIRRTKNVRKISILSTSLIFYPTFQVFYPNPFHSTNTIHSLPLYCVRLPQHKRRMKQTWIFNKIILRLDCIYNYSATILTGSSYSTARLNSTQLNVSVSFIHPCREGKLPLLSLLQCRFSRRF